MDASKSKMGDMVEKKKKKTNYKHAKSTHDPLSSRSLIPFPLGLLDVPT